MLTVPVRLLGDADRPDVELLLAHEPYTGAQIAERVTAAGLAWWRLDARLYGHGRRGVDSLCWAGANVIPLNAGPAAVAAYADLLSNEPRTCSSIVGEADAVLGLWDRLAPRWGPARDVRANQPLLVAAQLPAVRPDHGVRQVRPKELGMLYPAAVAMYTEEVGVPPTAGDGDGSYRERVRDLVRAGRAYARFDNGRVVFKAEVAVVTRYTAQIQGVWVAPEWRGRGMAVPGMAAVIRDVLTRVAPSVSLYVNDFNKPALRTYSRCGFRQVGTFATILF